MAVQLPLPTFFPPRSTFDQFWPGRNEQLIQSLRAIALGSGDPFLFLWGSAGLGKSHLLQATCHLAHQGGRRVSYLPMKDLLHHGSLIFERLGEQHLICIDDIDRVLGDASYEQDLFRLYNELRDRGHCLAVSASAPPTELSTKLPDLGSRLSWGMVFRIHPLNDEDTLAAIHLCARELGLDLSPQVSRFLMSHCHRHVGSLRRLLEELDAATLAAQRKLTIPFLKHFLERQA